MNIFNSVGYLYEPPYLTKEKGRTIAKFVFVIRPNAKMAPIFVKCVAFDNMADVIYINGQKGNMFGITGAVISFNSRMTAEGLKFENYVIVERAELIRKFKKVGEGMGFKEILELFPPESIVKRKKENKK
jgi:single-stranded DNA-binding protein